MKLILKNIGKVKDAAVEIKGITVIAGENDTGKSTVGKALFSIFNSFYDIDKRIRIERRESVERQLDSMLRGASIGEELMSMTGELAAEILYEIDKRDKSNEAISDVIYATMDAFDERYTAVISDHDLEKGTEQIEKIIAIPDGEIFKTVLQRNLDAEFYGQIGNIYVEDESLIQLEIRGEAITVMVADNKVVELDKRINMGTEAIYMDDPFILDEFQNRIWRESIRYSNHRNHLKSLLNRNSKQSNVIEEIVANEKFERIYNKVSEVCVGDIVKAKRASLEYRVGDKSLEVKNMSTGLKTFAILKKLLVSGYIETNGTIILDEPEIHLHPEWQLLFAELIVLLHKEFGLHILLNTHSPYFLNAIEVYAAKYEVADQCRYYLTQNSQMVSTIEDVTDEIEKIYRKLARPLQILENERYRND